METKDAISRAKSYIKQMFADETIDDVRLEELEFDENKNEWEVTIGFVRANEEKHSKSKKPSSLYTNYQQTTHSRSFKIIRMNDAGDFLALKSHPVEVQRQ